MSNKGNNINYAGVFLRKFIAGGFAGATNWFIVYPLDTVKSRMQSYDGKDRLKMRMVIKDVIQKHGVLYFYRGVHV